MVLGVALTAWIRPILNRAKDTTERDRVANENRVRKVSKFESPSKDEALSVVRHALAVRDPGGVARWIRPGAATAEQVVSYLAGVEAADGKAEDFLWMSNVNKNGLLLEGVQVTFFSPEKKRSRLAFLTPDDKGVWKMDFAAFARTIDPSWQELLDNAAASGVARVYTGRDDRYYNGPFSDEKAWVAYGMGSEDLDFSLYGYCKRGSTQHQAMEMLIAVGGQSLVRATLEVRKIPAADRRQFEITHVLAEDWVLAEVPFEATFDPK
jgi:hypothetical protein